MAVRVFPPGEHKEEIKQKMREGATVPQLAVEYPVSERQLWRYYKEVQDEKKGNPGAGGTPNPGGSTHVTPISKEAANPDGTVTPSPPGSTAPLYLNLLKMGVPYEDWGYSSSRNLLIVAETYHQAKEEYGFDQKQMKVGDFMAELCQAFRMMRGWDSIGAGYMKKEGEN